MSDIKLPKLRGRIVEKYGTITNFASELNTSKVMISRKLNEQSGFSKDDIIKWSEMLDISAEDVGEYFFMLDKLNELKNELNQV